MAHIRQSRPYSGFGFQVKFLENNQAVACSLGIKKKEKYQGLARELGRGGEYVPYWLALLESRKLRNFYVLLVNSVNFYQEFL